MTLTMTDGEDSETVDLVYEELNKTVQPDNSPIYAQLTKNETR